MLISTRHRQKPTFEKHKRNALPRSNAWSRRKELKDYWAVSVTALQDRTPALLYAMAATVCGPLAPLVQLKLYGELAIVPTKFQST
jgi:hypothetical protein